MALAAALALPAPRRDRAQPGRAPGDAAAPDLASAPRDSAAADTHPVRPGCLSALLHECPHARLLLLIPESRSVPHHRAHLHCGVA